jgi:ankyrin repeat protein
MSRTQSIMRVASTAAPVSGSEVRHRLVELGNEQVRQWAALQIQAALRLWMKVNRMSGVRKHWSKLDPATELCNAAAKGDVVRLHFLVREQGLDVDCGDYDKRTAIHLAASEGSLAVCVVLVDELGANHSPEDRWGGTPLNDATRHGHQAVCDYLKSVGGVLGTMAEDDPATELCNAASKADLPRLRLLVQKKGYDVDVGDYDRRTAIHLAASEGLLPVVQLLVDELGANHSPRDRWGNTPLNDAVRHRHSEVVTFLTEMGAVMGAPATIEADPATEMCSAAAKGDLTRLRNLVQDVGYDVNVGDYDKRTAIHLAASEGLLEVVQLLVELGADASPRDR